MASALASSIRSISLSSDVYRPVTAAIDFGTSSSGYAFAFKENGTERLKPPSLNKWQMGSASSTTDKAPTCLLLKPDMTFDSFGYDAEDEYARLCDTYKQKGWWYFEKFKMLLYQTKKLSRDVLIKDAEGKSMPAGDVFTIVIAHLKQRILYDVRSQNSGIKDDDILYVMTVPAIWSDAAKQFMREATTDSRVGIKDEQLILVLEPEAASVYCRHTLSDTIEKPDGNVELTSLPVGHKYIIADLGGGTIDIATHEVIEQDKLHEIHVARGDDLGGQKFDAQFLEFLESMFGRKIFEKWKASENGDYLTLLRTIEGIKWEITKSEKDVLLKIDNSLLEIIREYTDEGLEKLVSGSTFKKSVEEHIREITSEQGGIETIFLVGGLAKAPFIRDFIRLQFPRYRLIAPEDPGVAVLRGALLLGNTPQTIAGRIARYTYGIGVCPLFIEGVHREDYKITRDGKERCKHVFKKLIENGQVLKYGQMFETKTYIYAEKKETKSQTFSKYLYQSTQPDPMYRTDKGCTRLGGFTLIPPKGGWPDYCDVLNQLVVGEAEFKLHVNVLGKIYEKRIDFLLQ